MAENKKSFVLYSDLIHTVRKMNANDAGELLLHILEYVNDNDPETSNIVVDLTFEPIKQQLKRDLEKWGKIRVKRSEAGKASAEARKHKSTHVKSVEQKPTNSTVSDNVNVSVTVSDNVIKKKNTPPSFNDFQEYALSNSNKVDLQKLKWKYDSWLENGWKNGHGKPIKNWKSTLLNTIQYLESNGKQESKVVTDDFRREYLKKVSNRGAGS